MAPRRLRRRVAVVEAYKNGLENKKQEGVEILLATMPFSFIIPFGFSNLLEGGEEVCRETDPNSSGMALRKTKDP